MAFWITIGILFFLRLAWLTYLESTPKALAEKAAKEEASRKAWRDYFDREEKEKARLRFLESPEAREFTRNYF